jgi:hypothetical protein
MQATRVHEARMLSICHECRAEQLARSVLNTSPSKEQDPAIRAGMHVTINPNLYLEPI